MKVTLGVDDVIILDGNDVAEIVAFVKALRDVGEVSPTPKPKREPKPKPEPEVLLSTKQMQTWQWLVDNDTTVGRSPEELAKCVGIELGAAQNRLSTLVKNGMAHRVSRGLYRPGEN